MKVVILAGGQGSRLSEETRFKPKPMIEIGGKPILWHIMKCYSFYGFHDFIICLGYKGYLIKEYFVNYFLHMCDITLDIARQQMEVHENKAEPWRVTLVDTGERTMTGGRIKRIRQYLDEEDFCLTYGDGVADIRIDDLVAFHKAHERLATITAVQPIGRFGSMEISGDNEVTAFVEKPPGDGGWINGGFFVLSAKVIDYIDGDQSIWEQAPLTDLASDDQLAAYKHTGFWHPMDTMRDRRYLEDLWESGSPPWQVWK